MTFRSIVDEFLSGSRELRSASTIELRNLSGMPLGGRRSSQESLLTLHGDGLLELCRRGDFGERGDEPPGRWQGRCEEAEVEPIWHALRDLGQESFPSRPSDPGETSYELQIQSGGSVARLSWGPGHPGVACPGEDAIEPLRMLEVQAQQKTFWEVRANQGKIGRSSGGLVIELELTNQGSQAVSLVYSPAGKGKEFLFKFAEDKEAPPGVTPLPVTWMRQDLQPVDLKDIRLALLEAGGRLTLNLAAPIELEPGRRYLGQVSYTQLAHGERLAGIDIFSGMTFTDVFEFKGPE